MWSAVPYIQSLTKHLYLLLSRSTSLYTALLSPRYLLFNIILLPLYRSFPYSSICSCRVAGTVVNLDGSNSRTAISHHLIKE
jgi:hypothetical protein